MKKKYEKPALLIEEFSLAQNIASCGAGSSGHDNPFGEAKHGSKTSCGWYMPGMGQTIFMTGACQIKTNEMNGICYNTPSANYSIFAS